MKPHIIRISNLDLAKTRILGFPQKIRNMTRFAGGKCRISKLLGESHYSLKDKNLSRVRMYNVHCTISKKLAWL